MTGIVLLQRKAISSPRTLRVLAPFENLVRLLYIASTTLFGSAVHAPILTIDAGCLGEQAGAFCKVHRSPSAVTHVYCSSSKIGNAWRLLLCQRQAGLGHHSPAGWPGNQADGQKQRPRISRRGTILFFSYSPTG